MSKIDLKPLPSKEAIIHFNGKTLLTSKSYLDVKAHEHALAFTVAKMLDEDLLQNTRDLIAKSLENGTSFHEFKRQLKPLLSKDGWGNMTDDKTKLNRRLRTIYHTNLHSAYSAGQWERVQKTKEFLPFLQYMPSLSENQRLAHKRYYNLVRAVDDPIWQSIFPPNSYGCKCWVKQLTHTKAQKILDEQAKKGIVYDIEMEEVKHPLTGEIMTVPKGVHFSFNHNHDRFTAMLELAEDKHGKNFVYTLKQQVIKHFPKVIPISLLDYKEMAEIGKTIFEKHELDKVDFNKPHEFSHALIQALKKEGVEFGAIANIVGDEKEQVIQILKRFPKTWVEKANSVGQSHIRNVEERGFQSFIYSDWHLQRAKTRTKTDENYFVFANAVNDTKVGDSWMRLNGLNGKSGGYNVAIHEFAHRLQFVIPSLNDYFKSLWLARTQGEKTRPLARIQVERGETPRYEIKEVGRKDNFVNVYIGKNYGTDENPLPMEVMTMTFEVLLGDNMAKNNPNRSEILKYWQNDPEMVYLGIGLLLRFEP